MRFLRKLVVALIVLAAVGAAGFWFLTRAELLSPEQVAALGTGGRTVDLKAIARDRLEAAGVVEVHDCGLCTICDAGRFFSHRRDRGVTGRQAGLAWRS